jgi:type II secretion system protein D
MEKAAEADQAADKIENSKKTINEVKKMDWVKSIISVVVGIAAVLIIWRVGFVPDPPISGQAEKPTETKVVAEAEKSVEAQKPDAVDKTKVASEGSKPERPGGVAGKPKRPGDVNEPSRVVAVGDSRGPDDVRGQIRTAVITEPGKSAEPNEPMEIINLKNVEMKVIIEKLARWTGKVIIPTDESLKQKITIYSPEKLPRSKALAMIYSALRIKGYIAEQTDGTIFLKPITEAKLGEVPTISEDYPLAMVENKDQVVQKFFKLENYSPSQMGQIILPLVGEYGYVSADESTGSLFVIDTVKSLMRISMIIKQFDVVEVEEILTEIFEIQHGDPTAMVELLQTLLGDGSSLSSPGRGRGPFSRGGPPSSSSRSKSSGGTAQTVTVGTGRRPALLIPQPTYNWIIVKATAEDIKKIGEWIEKLDRAVPTVYVDEPLSAIENKNQVVQKFFKLENYSPSQMSQIVGPLLSDTGYVSADETTGNLVVIDTVDKLMRIEMIIGEFDVPEAEQTVTDIFEIRNGDPSEIVQLLRMLISGEAGTSSRSTGRSSSYGRSSYGRSSYGRSSYSNRGYSSSSRNRSGSSQSVLIGPSDQPVVLIPEPQRKWIIARASAEDMKMIGKWIERLDQEEPVTSEHETVPITYADVEETAERLNEAMQQMPGSELTASVLIQPLAQARQIVIYGREDMRTMVKKLIKEIDIPTGLFKTEHFNLKYADPDQIKEKIEELYEASTVGSGSRYTYVFNYGSSRGGSSAMSPDTVRVISYPTLKQVTIIASAENMTKVRAQIEEWDVPLDVERVQPLIIELHNSDPVQMAELLRTLFSEEGGGGMNIYDMLFGRGTEEKAKIVGPLYGQLTFESVPQTKKMIVISKIPEAYEVIKKLILDLDRQEMAEVPKVIELKYADPEDLSERLNAMFVEAGQTARIRLTEQGLSESSSMDDPDDVSSTSNQGDTTSEANTYTPPWSGSGARMGINEEMPISNVIGRIRFVPEPHTKSILTLAPPEFMDEIEGMIAELDVPGKQVMMEAIIIEVEHSKVTSLGIELSTNPNAFGSIGENAILALSNLTNLGVSGTTTGIISPAEGVAATGGSGTLIGIGTDVYALIDFLVKTTDAKILNQQTLWTKDNEEAKFFKGQTVAFLGSESITNQTTSQNVDFENVGMELLARPSITPENKVDMVVNVEISSLLEDLVNSQPVRSTMKTRTNMIVQDSQTLLLGGILFQKDSTVIAKVPLFGDLPLIGGLFRHNKLQQINSELLVFITPHVIDESAENIPEATKEKIEQPKKKLEDVKEHLKEKVEELAWEMP